MDETSTQAPTLVGTRASDSAEPLGQLAEPPKNGAPINCHTCARHIIAEWEYTGGSLYYFDFATGSFHRQFTKRLFAIEGLNSSDVDNKIAKHVETPLAPLKTFAPSKAPVILGRAQIDALNLYLAAQTARVCKATGHVNPPILDDLFGRLEDQLGAVAALESAGYRWAQITVTPNNIMFYPEVGFFAVPLEGKAPARSTYAYAIPLTPFVATIRIPNGCSDDSVQRVREFLPTFSLGLDDHSNRVIVPRGLHKDMPEAELRARMLNGRNQARAWFRAFLQRNPLLTPRGAADLNV